MTASRSIRLTAAALVATIVATAALVLGAGRAGAIPSACASHDDGYDQQRSYVCFLYSALHPPREGEVAYWIDVLNTSGRPATVAGTWDSRELLSIQIMVDYSTFFERDPDAAGAQHWLDAMLSGTWREQVDAALASSDEAFQRYGGTIESWVAGLYNTMLDRDGSPEEIAYWAGLVQSGVLDRYSTALAFATSDERVGGELSDAYFLILDRAPDGAGLAYWTGVAHAIGLHKTGLLLAETDECYGRFAPV
jgi:hypothetical protein